MVLSFLMCFFVPFNFRFIFVLIFVSLISVLYLLSSNIYVGDSHETKKKNHAFDDTGSKTGITTLAISTDLSDKAPENSRLWPFFKIAAIWNLQKMIYLINGYLPNRF